MLFNSFTFVGFFIVVYALYLLLQNRHILQNRLLLVASYVFYGSWDWRFLGLLLVSTLVDYFAARWIHQSSDQTRRRQFLLLSIVVNLAILGFFKYFNFFGDSVTALFDIFGMEPGFVTLNIILPVGISFYTFQSMGYTIDVFRGKIAPSRKILDYALYVSFFPQLVAGPIERASSLLPQITSRRIVSPSQVNAGLYLILWGFFKKVVIADRMGLIADEVFTNPGQYQGWEIIIGIFAFTIQIYADFSGYSDIARGVAKMMGFDLMVNFKLPYFARNPSEFWRRWHISLSTWIRDYIYIPLGGNRKGRARAHLNLLIVMALAGLWHGAAWNFIIWGAYHGVLLSAHRLFLELTPIRGFSGGWLARGQLFLQIVFMFGLTMFGWLIFRSESVSQFVEMVTSISPQVSAESLRWTYTVLFFTTPLILVQVLQHRTNELLVLTRQLFPVRAAAYSFMLIWIVIFAVRQPSEFIYFQF